jgi:hypothetical protein
MFVTEQRIKLNNESNQNENHPINQFWPKSEKDCRGIIDVVRIIKVIAWRDKIKPLKLFHIYMLITRVHSIVK